MPHADLLGHGIQEYGFGGRRLSFGGRRTNHILLSFGLRQRAQKKLVLQPAGCNGHGVATRQRRLTVGDGFDRHG